jgi:hypothetical protein
VFDGQGEARVGGELRALGRGDREVVDREALVAAVEAEHLADHAEFEGVHSVEQDHGHVLQHAASVRPGWQ